MVGDERRRASGRPRSARPLYGKPLAASCVTSWPAPTVPTVVSLSPARISTFVCPASGARFISGSIDPGREDAEDPPGHEPGHRRHARVVHDEAAAARVADRGDGHALRDVRQRSRDALHQVLQPVGPETGTSRSRGRRPRSPRARDARATAGGSRASSRAGCRARARRGRSASASPPAAKTQRASRRARRRCTVNAGGAGVRRAAQPHAASDEREHEQQRPAHRRLRQRPTAFVVGPALSTASSLERPRVESNHRTELRRLPLCPLSYGAERSQLSAGTRRGARNERGWRTGLEPATTGTTTRGSTN